MKYAQVCLSVDLKPRTVLLYYSCSNTLKTNKDQCQWQKKERKKRERPTSTTRNRIKMENGTWSQGHMSVTFSWSMLYTYISNLTHHTLWSSSCQCIEHFLWCPILAHFGGVSTSSSSTLLVLYLGYNGNRIMLVLCNMAMTHAFLSFGIKYRLIVIIRKASQTGTGSRNFE